MLHRFAKLVAVCTGGLILAGSLVTSNGAGLSVPDWPTSYGWNMFTFPPSMWVGNIVYEHGHRLIASTVGFLTIILAVWLWRADPRRWMRWLGVSALGAVIAQGVLGGITVLFFLPAAISTAHAGLAEIFFCITVAIALFTSPGWIGGYAVSRPGPLDPASQAGPKGPALRMGGSEAVGRPGPLDPASEAGPKGPALRMSRGPAPRMGKGPAPQMGDGLGADDGVLRAIATLTTVAIYVQILLGATMRHTDAGLAIPDFPLMFGHLIPPHWDAKIAIHFAHRTGALVATLLILGTSAHIWYHHGRRRELVRPASLIVGLVAVQLTLGALTVLTRRNVWINSAHVVGGALVLTTSLVIALRSWRVRFADASGFRRGLPHEALHETPATSAAAPVRSMASASRLTAGATRASAPTVAPGGRA